MEDTKSLRELSIALGELEDRVTKLESMPVDNGLMSEHITLHHNRKMDMFDVASKTVNFLDKNGDILIALALVIVANIVIWRKL